MEGAYNWEGRDFQEAFRRVTAAYEVTPVAEGVQSKEKIRYKNYDEFAIETNKEKLTNMKSVHAVPESKLLHSGKTLRESYQEYFDSKGGVIHSEEFGDIALTNSSIRSEIRHGSTAEKIASIEAIESVVQNGVVIYDKSKYNNDSHRIVVAAPIKIGNTPYYMGVMLQRDGNGQRLYIHDVTIEKETNDSSSVSLNTTVANEENGGLFLSNILQDAMRVKYPVKQSVDDSVASKRNEVNTQENNRAERLWQMLVEEPKKEHSKAKWWNLFKTHFLDKGAVFEDLSLKTHNRRLMEKWNFTLSARARAQHLIGEGFLTINLWFA